MRNALQRTRKKNLNKKFELDTAGEEITEGSDAI